MSARTIPLDDALYRYLLSVSLREPAVLRKLREETAQIPMSGMQISPEQGQFMALLVSLIGARKCLEIGVYTGYSSISVALALPAGGKIVACDINPKWTAVAQRYWREAGIADKVDLRLAPALETLQRLMQSGEAGSFDFAFIDADKSNYSAYYENTLELLRLGGLVAVDNVLWDGKVVDPDAKDEATAAIRAFNEKLARDDRIRLSLIPIGDGLTLAQKR